MIPTGLRSLRGLRSRRLALSRVSRAWPRSHQHSSTPDRKFGPSPLYIHPEPKPPREEKPYYITTPIFYVNAAPHIGHLYTMVLADVLKRWQLLKGKEVFLSTGTDEHGMKIQRAAAGENVTPQELCDTNSKKFMRLCRDGGLCEDTFIRTTQDEHRVAVQEFWSQLNQLPRSLGLYKGTHAGWYSVSDECFYPEKLVEASIEPQTGKKIMVSTETRSRVEWIEEETWFFPLTKYKDRLLKFYDENPGWIQPESKMKEVRHWVENHLEDLSVTRPHDRLKWGIRNPDDKKHTIYVWVDALINYLTVAGFGEEWRRFDDVSGPNHDPKHVDNLWPADMHIVGKDIIRFHAVYWPALLLALNLPLPKKILCHNHWTMSNRKMSKSVGNVVNPNFAIQRWGTDPLRYFLMRNGSLSKDMDYSNHVVHAIYIKELMANLGNLFYRIAKPKVPMWSTEEALDSYLEGDFERNRILDKPGVINEHYSALEPVLDKVTPAFQEQMDNNNISGAISEVYTLLSKTNRYVSDTGPWRLVKQRDMPEARVLVDWIIFNCAEALRIAGILLQPIMPSKCERLLDELNVRPGRRTLKWAKRGADDNYGLSRVQLESLGRLSPWDTLFPPVPGAELSDEQVREELGYFLKNAGRQRLSSIAHYIAMEARMGEDAVRKLCDSQKPKGRMVTGTPRE